MAADYFVRQGRDADALAAELDTADKRRRYIAGFYGHRFWAAPGAFTREDVDFLTEPFADAASCGPRSGTTRAPWAPGRCRSAPRFFETNPVPTLALYGPDDHVIWRDFPERCEVVFTDLVGPFVVPRAGHFLQWERAELLTRTVVSFLRDLSPARLRCPSMADDADLTGARSPRRESGIAAASARVAAIVEAAEQAAADLREQTERRARERIAEADRAADLRVEAAEAEAADLLAAAQADAAGAREQAARDARGEHEAAQRARADLEAQARAAAQEATQEAARLRAQAAEEAERTRAKAREEARAVVHDARVAAGEVLREGTELQRRSTRPVVVPAPQRRAAASATSRTPTRA